jgi:uncharacterized Zn-finger protein
MEHMMAVYCTSSACKQSGNSQKEIRVWFEAGPGNDNTVQSIICPYCSGSFSTDLRRKGVEYSVEKILKVEGT